MSSSRPPVDLAAVLNDIANVRARAPYFVAALEVYFEQMLKAETGFLDRPNPTDVHSKTPRAIDYALGLRDGLLRGRFVLDALERKVTRAFEQEQQRHATALATPTAGPVPDGPNGPAAVSTRATIPVQRAPTPGIPGVSPEWVSTGGRG